MTAKRLVTIRSIFKACTGGSFYTHHQPDVDAVFSLWIIYYFLNKLFPIPLTEFIKMVRFESADYTPSEGDFGVDIGFGNHSNNIKEDFCPVYINSKYGYSNVPVCASMYLANILLSRDEFQALSSTILAVQDVDCNGNSRFNNNQTSLWGIIGAINDTNDFKTLFTVAHYMFSSTMQRALEQNTNMTIQLSDIKLQNVFDTDNQSYTIAIPPTNAGRHIAQRCFRELYANVVIFSSFSENTGLGTVGITVSKKFSQLFRVEDLLNDANLEKFIVDVDNKLLVTDHAIGRTDKSPFPTTKEKILEYRDAFIRASSNLIHAGPIAAQNADDQTVA
jgi:hypothetical protein